MRVGYRSLSADLRQLPVSGAGGSGTTIGVPVAGSGTTSPKTSASMSIVNTSAGGPLSAVPHGRHVVASTVTGAVRLLGIRDLGHKRTALHFYDLSPDG